MHVPKDQPRRFCLKSSALVARIQAEPNENVSDKSGLTFVIADSAMDLRCLAVISARRLLPDSKVPNGDTVSTVVVFLQRGFVVCGAMLSPGDKIRDYEIIAPLCVGGMAMLYVARKRGVGGFNRLVTLKIVHPHLVADESITKLFLDEARLLAHVAHPNVVHVEEVGQCGGSYFIAMEYVHGVSVAELLALMNERRLRPRSKLCVWSAAQVAEALHAAHETRDQSGAALDIVHRDVSPQNVLISHTGHIKLIDFGVAKSYAEAGQRTAGRMVFGKLRYLSPEQLQLERADRRSDVYALGVMLWEMLAGRSLLRCQRLDDERDWATREAPPAPSTYSPHATPELDRVVLKAIAFAASERYENAFEFRSALLRAEPSAAKVDAPMVAAVVHSLLGDQLDRRRASWPTEVAEGLKVPSDVTGSEIRSLDELTSDDVMNPTRPDLGHPSTSVTLRVAAVSALTGTAEHAESAVSKRLLRTTAFGAACLTLGVLVGRFLLPVRPPEVADALEAGRRSTRSAGQDCAPGAPVIDGHALALSPVRERELRVEPQHQAVTRAQSEPEARKPPEPAHDANRRASSRAKQSKPHASTSRRPSSWSRQAHDRIIRSLD